MNLLKLPSTIVNKYRDYRTTASTPRHDDVYIVEFPKSGVTWFSTIIANMALIASGKQELATFASVGMHVPDIHLNRNIGNVIYDNPPVRFIKSHATFNKNYSFIIYLVRHPLDVMKSYYRYNEEAGGKRFSSFDEFCRSEEMGIPAWKYHVNSWMYGDERRRIHVCRYEDLIANAAKVVEDVCKNFGWNITDAVINEALSRSSVKPMKDSEEFYRSNNASYRMTFVKGINKMNITDETVRYIDEECQRELEFFGYK